MLSNIVLITFCIYVPTSSTTDIAMFAPKDSDGSEGVFTENQALKKDDLNSEEILNNLEDYKTNEKIYSDEEEISHQETTKTRSKRSVIGSHKCPYGQVHLPPPINKCVSQKEYNDFTNDDYDDSSDQ